MKFWGYKLGNGELKTRRYFDQGDIDEARESPFVDSVCEPFEVSGWPEADKKIKEHFSDDAETVS